MKSFKKTLSVLTALVMVLLLFSVIPVMQASAAAGDVWSISHSSTNWRYIASGLSYNIDTKMVTVPANTSIGTQKYILLTNNYSTPDNAISPNTTYRIKFDVSSQGKDISLYSARVGYAYNISPASGNNYHQSVSQISNLTSYSTLFEDTSYKKYHVTIDYKTPATLGGTPAFLELFVAFTSNQEVPIYVNNITTKQRDYYNVIDNDNDELLGTVNATDGDNVMDVLAENGYEKYSYTLSSDVSTIAKTTKEIRVTYTPPADCIQNIKFDSTYGGVSVADGQKWHYYSTSDGHHLNITNGKITLISGQNHIPVQNADSVPQYCFTLANNYMDSGLEAGETYSVQFELTSAATISSHAADVQFGQDEWTAIVPGANVRYDGAALQSMVVATADAGGGKTTYTLSMSVTLPKTGWTNSCRNILLSVYCGTNQQYTIDNIVITPKEKTVFGGHSLVLEDAIGVNFFVSKGDLSVEELTGSYVTFEIENSDTNKSVDIEDAFVSGNKYGFTCFLSSVQMAESVTPTFHAGTGETFSGSAYSVKNYIDYINANQVNYEENVVRLVNSIANYGYYAQHRFTSKTFTALASSYAKRSYNSDYYEYISGDIISSQLTTDGIDKGTGSDQFQYTLNFDSTTSIVIKFYTENVSFTEVTKGGADYTDWKNNYTGGDCTLYLLHLPISQLGERITVSGKVNGQDFTISVSGLSYIYNAIDSGTDATKNVSSALYEYYKDAYYYANNIPLDRDLSAVWI